jgi:hypothetical protein
LVQVLDRRNGIPLAIAVAAPAEPPTLKLTVSGGSITVSWAADATGFTLESNASYSSTGWSAVPGVANNSVTLTVGAGNQFLRLRK